MPGGGATVARFPVPVMMTLWSLCMSPFSFQRGETIQLALDLASGEAAAISAVSAQLRPVDPGRLAVAADAPLAASFAVSERAATAELPAGWTLTISAAESAALPAGLYAADARISVAGGVCITEPVVLRLRDSVTQP